jgi:hypothetical protein
MKNLSLAAVRSAFGILERHFPERLAVLYMLDAPAIFTATWHLIEPFIDPTSRAKLQFISGAAGRATLLKVSGDWQACWAWLGGLGLGWAVLLQRMHCVPRP